MSDEQHPKYKWIFEMSNDECPVFDCLFNANGDCKEKHVEPGYCVWCDQGHGPLDERSHNGTYRCGSCYRCMVFISKHE